LRFGPKGERAKQCPQESCKTRGEKKNKKRERGKGKGETYAPPSSKLIAELPITLLKGNGN
jgi:hypothetical protein